MSSASIKLNDGSNLTWHATVYNPSHNKMIKSFVKYIVKNVPDKERQIRILSEVVEDPSSCEKCMGIPIDKDLLQYRIDKYVHGKHEDEDEDEKDKEKVEMKASLVDEKMLDDDEDEEKEKASEQGGYDMMLRIGDHISISTPNATYTVVIVVAELDHSFGEMYLLSNSDTGSSSLPQKTSNGQQINWWLSGYEYKWHLFPVVNGEIHHNAMVDVISVVV
jgi:hypothetical protein